MVMKTIFLFFLTLLTVTGFSQYNGAVKKPYVAGQFYGYIEYVPSNAIPNPSCPCMNVKFPILIFLHGNGETGSGNDVDLEKIYTHGPPALIKAGTWPAKSGDRFIVIAPQALSTFNAEKLRDFINYIEANYPNADTTKVYLTGLSYGAFKTYDYLSKYPYDVAACVSIAGNGTSNSDTPEEVNMLIQTPHWAFHGDADPTVTKNGSINPITRMNAVNCTPKAKITIYTGVTHNSWARTYDLSGMNSTVVSAAYDPYDSSIYDWLLQYQKQ